MTVAANPTRQLSQCEGKHKYESATAAQQGVSNRLRRLVRPYHCQICQGWHVGSVEGGRRKRVARDQRQKKATDAR